MSTQPFRFKALLDDHGVAYEVIHHRRDYTAQETAADTHTPGRMFAKCVLIWRDGAYAMAVLPAHHVVDMRKLCQVLGAKEVKLASEEEIRELCPDCEAGALPPFGNLYDMPVYVSRALTDAEHITFNAGTHSDVVRMRYADWEKLAQPHVADFSRLA
jgi:Ala-tRNA(Pro) deacylase